MYINIIYIPDLEPEAEAAHRLDTADASGSGSVILNIYYMLFTATCLGRLANRLEHSSGVVLDPMHFFQQGPWT